MFVTQYTSCILAIVTLAASKVAVRSNSDAVIQAIIKSRFDIFRNECQFDAEERVPCGRAVSSELECRARGCCWRQCDNCDSQVPSCFLAHRMLREECQVAYEDKDDCGYYGITEGECYMRDCCWAPSPLVNDPPCFQKSKKSAMRLVDGPDQSAGRVEIRHDGEWGTVCDDDFDDDEAQVVCKALGYSYGMALAGGSFGEGSGPIWLDDVYCSGEEESLSMCSHSGWGEHNCDHSEDAAVQCSNEPNEPDEGESSLPAEMRLVDGSDPSQGRLEIYHDGQWGTVCDDEFSDQAAKVVCNALGYGSHSDHITWHGSAHCGEGSGPIWLDSLTCLGEELSLSQCTHDDWGYTDCGHYEDVCVVCGNPDDDDSSEEDLSASGFGSGYEY